MKATEILTQEHRVIERVLDALESAAVHAEAGTPIRPSFFTDVADFIHHFADGCHHRKEEGVLFKAMEAAGMSAEDGPIAVMLAEHERARALTRSMAAAADRWQQGDGGARGETLRVARECVALLREHILKEDSVLFPLATHVIPHERHTMVADAVEQLEREEAAAGMHRRFRALADTLGAEAPG